MLTNTPFLGFNRWTDRCTFTASSAAAGFEAANLGALPLGVPWASTSGADQVIYGEFDTDLLVQALWLCRPDLTDSASFRLRFYSTTVAAQDDAHKLYDSHGDTALVGLERFWPIVYDDDQIEWEGENWFEGSYTTREKSDTVFHRPIIAPDQYLIRSWRLDLSDPGAAAAFGCMRLGMIEIAQGRALPRSFALGRQSDFDVRTTTVTPYGGADVHNRLSKKRTFNGDLRLLPRAEVMGVIYEMMRQYDLDTPFGFCADPTDPTSWLRECFLAKFEKLTPLSRGAVDYANSTLSLKEAF